MDPLNKDWQRDAQEVAKKLGISCSAATEEIRKVGVEVLLCNGSAEPNDAAAAAPPQNPPQTQRSMLPWHVFRYSWPGAYVYSTSKDGQEELKRFNRGAVVPKCDKFNEIARSYKEAPHIHMCEVDFKSAQLAVDYCRVMTATNKDNNTKKAAITAEYWSRVKI